MNDKPGSKKPAQKRFDRSPRPGTGKPGYRTGDARPATGKPGYRTGDARPGTGKPGYRTGDARPATGKPGYHTNNTRPTGERPARPMGDRPPRPMGDHPPRPMGERPLRPMGDHPPRPMGDRPPRPMGDRPARPMGERPPRPPRGEKRPAPAAPQSNANPRRVAMNVVNDVLEGDAYASLSLDDRLSKVNLNQLDRRLCASIAYRTLENLIKIDYALSGFLHDADAIEPRVRNILRTAACQILLHDRVPDSAAVNEAVKLTREIGMEPLSGMVNAVLRRLTDGKEAIVWPDKEAGAKYLSVMYSLPEWLAQALTDDYGAQEAEKIAAFRTERHYVTLRPTFGQSAAEFQKLLDGKVWETEAGVMPGAVRVHGAMQIARDTAFINGLFSIQGEGSMLAAAAVDAKRGMNILDCCAAPGGKAAYMAERMDGTGRVYAWDVHDHRVDLIQATVRRLHLENVRAALRDATVLREELCDTLDAVLIDAPCSGIGVMDDKPDVKYRLTKEGLASLAATQKALLDTCSRYVKRGGTLVYSTCSMLKDENERQIQAFLSAHPQFALDALPAGIPGALRAQCGAYGLQLLPHRDGIEGFFVARMKRIDG